MDAHLFALQSRKRVSLLIVFADLSRFSTDARQADERRLADIVDEFYERVAGNAQKANGEVVKFIGDAALLVFPESHVDEAVNQLLEMKREVDAWFLARGWESRLVVKAHFGPVIAGPYGGKDDKRFDVIGNTVNTAATLQTRSIAISPQVFRKLKPETRKRFKKHTPLITYIPIEARRP